MLLVLQESQDQTIRPDRVDRGHDHLGEGSTYGNLVWSLRLDPIDPLGLLRIEAKVKEALPLCSQNSLELDRLGILFL